MLSLLISILALGAIIAFHEAGHFIAARLFKVGVIEFSIGMGPRIASRIAGNTRYSLRALPFGGSCMMLGEDMEEEGDEEDGEFSANASGPDTPPGAESPGTPEKKLHRGSITNGCPDADERMVLDDAVIIDGRRFLKEEQFVSKAAWQRFIIIAAGPVFNFLLAFLMALIITAAYGYDRPVIKAVDEGGPMAAAGIEAGDIIKGMAVTEGIVRPVRPESIETARDLQLFLYMHSDDLQDARTFIIRYRDADTEEIRDTAVVPFYDEEEGRCRLGFTYSLAYGPADGIADIVYYSIYDVRYCIKSALLALRLLFRGSLESSDVMGPVRMVAVMDEAVDEAADYGAAAALMTLLDLMILISGSLGAANLLPIPALDGGRLVFVVIEMLLGRRVPPEIEGRIHVAGMMLLLMLMMVIMFNDVILLAAGGQ